MKADSKVEGWAQAEQKRPKGAKQQNGMQGRLWSTERQTKIRIETKDDSRQTIDKTVDEGRQKVDVRKQTINGREQTKQATILETECKADEKESSGCELAGTVGA